MSKYLHKSPLSHICTNNSLRYIHSVNIWRCTSNSDLAITSFGSMPPRLVSLTWLAIGLRLIFVNEWLPPPPQTIHFQSYYKSLILNWEREMDRGTQQVREGRSENSKRCGKRHKAKTKEKSDRMGVGRGEGVEKRVKGRGWCWEERLCVPGVPVCL